ncbi:MAG: DDE-type integrase/transposase/recombinase [Saccharospirillaceae bacterium]|nr:DDE-type integrase/transposase/recombinase [Saccharospirillaceae bacterium]
MYTRKKRKSSPIMSRYKFVSQKMGVTYLVDEKHEFDFCFILEYTDDVTSFQVQQEEYYYEFNGRSCRYTPDFLVQYQNGIEPFIEIKPRSYINDPEFRERFTLKKEVASEMGRSLILITNKQIQKDYRLNNYKLIHRCSPLQSLTDIHLAILDCLYEQPLPITRLHQILCHDLIELIAAVTLLLFKKKLQADLTNYLLDENLVVELYNGLRNNDLFHDEFEDDVEPKNIIDNSLDYRDLDSFPDKVQQDALFKKTYIDAIYKHLKGSKWVDSTVSPLIEEVSSKYGIKKVSVRSLRRWKNAYEDADKSIVALIPKHHLKGNSTRKIDERNEHFISNAIKRYLVKERPSIADSYEIYEDSVYIYNSNNAEFIKPMSYRAFYNRIHAIPQYNRTLARDGKEKAEREYRTVYSHKRVSRVMQKVEIDHTPLDIILLDDELDIALGRAYLTLLIDKYSKCIVGFYITFKEPSYLSVQTAILNTLKSKTEVLKRFPEIKNDWPCYGKMESLVVDNGAEFWSESLEQACNELNIQIDYNPPGKPWLKPFVERVFGTIIRKFIGRFPGKTFSNIAEKDNYDPVKDAVIHFSVFNELFHKWIVDIYNQDKDARSTHIPILSWTNAVKKMKPITFTDDELSIAAIILGKSDQCSLREAGIHLHSLRYDSDELSKYRKEHTTNRDPKVTVKTDLNDISSVHVYLPKLKRYLKVPCIDPEGYTKGLSLHHHQIARKMHKNFIESKVDKTELAKSRVYINQRVDDEVELMAKSKRKHSKKLSGISAIAKYREVNSENVGTIKANSISQPVKTKLDPSDSKDQFDDWDDDVPDL